MNDSTTVNSSAPSLQGLSRVAARVGVAIIVWVLIRIACEFLTIPIASYLKAVGSTNDTIQVVSLAVSAAGAYLIGTPVALWILGVFQNRGLRGMFQKSSLPARELLAAIPMAYTVTITLNLIATVILTLAHGSVNEVLEQNPFLNLATSNLAVALNYLWMVIAAPVFEELLFRGGVLTALKPYGNWFAVIVSALLFGLSHVNISQMLYATALGVVLGMVRVKSGSVTPGIIMHLCINFLGITVATLYSLEIMALLVPVVALVLTALISGIVLLIVSIMRRRDRFQLENNAPELSKKEKLGGLLRSPLFVIMFLLTLSIGIAINIPGIMRLFTTGA